MERWKKNPKRFESSKRNGNFPPSVMTFSFENILLVSRTNLYPPKRQLNPKSNSKERKCMGSDTAAYS